MLGVAIGVIVGVPFAHYAALRDPAVEAYTIHVTDPWGSPGGPPTVGTVNAAGYSIMSASIGIGLFVGLSIGLIRAGFFAIRPPESTKCGPAPATRMESTS
jgi:hypothetical protein